MQNPGRALNILSLMIVFIARKILSMPLISRAIISLSMILQNMKRRAITLLTWQKMQAVPGKSKQTLMELGPFIPVLAVVFLLHTNRIWTNSGIRYRSLTTLTPDHRVQNIPQLALLPVLSISRAFILMIFVSR